MNYGKVYDEQVADTYDEDALGLLTGVRGLALAQLARCELPASPTILDLGVGTGETLVALRGRFPQGRMIGIDLSERMIEAAKRKLTLEAHVADACDAGKYVACGSADLAIAHFLTTFVDRRRLFRVAAETLRAGGLFSVVSTPAEAFRGVREGVGRLLGNAGLAAAVSPAPENGETLAAELRETGFEIRAVEAFRKPVVFQSFEEALDWGTKSGFFAHAVAAMGPEQIAALARLTTGMFPFHDEYVGVAILAAMPGSR